MLYHILGRGSVGSLLAVHLRRAGHNVEMIVNTTPPGAGCVRHTIGFHPSSGRNTLAVPFHRRRAVRHNRSDVRVEFSWKAHDSEQEELAMKSAKCDSLEKTEEKVVKLRRGSLSEVKGISRHFKSKQADVLRSSTCRVALDACRRP